MFIITGNIFLTNQYNALRIFSELLRNHEFEQDSYLIIIDEIC